MKLLKQAQAVLALGVLSLAASATATTFSGSFGTPVTDNDPAGVSSTITIADAGVVSGLTVGVVIDHTWVGDLIMTLTAPDGTTITLMDRPGSPAGSGSVGTDLDITEINFDDAALLAAEDIMIDTDPTGLTVSPDDMLASLDGGSITGDWTLTISDNAALDNNMFAPTWSLTFDAAPVPVPAAIWLMLSALGGLRLMRRR